MRYANNFSAIPPVTALGLLWATQPVLSENPLQRVSSSSKSLSIWANLCWFCFLEIHSNCNSLYSAPFSQQTIVHTDWVNKLTIPLSYSNIHIMKMSLVSLDNIRDTEEEDIFIQKYLCSSIFKYISVEAFQFFPVNSLIFPSHQSYTYMRSISIS